MRAIPVLILTALLAGAATAAQAAPTATCIWTGLPAADRTAFQTAMASNGRPTDAVLTSIAAALRTCGFESTTTGRERGGFLAAMAAHRGITEAGLQQGAAVTSAALDRAYGQLPAPFRAQMISAVRARFEGQPPVNPSAAEIVALATRLRITGEANLGLLRRYLLVRATIEYVESVGAAYHAPRA